MEAGDAIHKCGFKIRGIIVLGVATHKCGFEIRGIIQYTNSVIN